MMDDVPIPISAFIKKFAWPTEGALRGYIHTSKEKGLEKAFVKFGRRVLVKPKTFFELVEKSRENEQKRGTTAKTDEKGVKG